MRVVCNKHGVVATVQHNGAYDIGVCPGCVEDGTVRPDLRWPCRLEPFVVTSTGRFQCREPNVSNTPKAK